MRLNVDPSTDPTDYVFRHRIRVRFVETDAMGIVHHSNYLAYFEEARVAYLADIGHPFTAWRDEGLESPVLESFVQYRVPLRFDDVVTVHLRLAEVTRATFQMAYLITIDTPGTIDPAGTIDRAGTVDTLGTMDREPTGDDPEPSRPIARATGVTVHGCTNAVTGRPTRLPAWLRALGHG